MCKRTAQTKPLTQTKHPTWSPTFTANHVYDFIFFQRIQACFKNFHPAGNNVPALFRTNTLFWLAWCHFRNAAFSWGIMQFYLSQVLKMPEWLLAPSKPWLYGILLSITGKLRESGKSQAAIFTLVTFSLWAVCSPWSLRCFPPADNGNMWFFLLCKIILRLFWIICQIFMCILLLIFIIQSARPKTSSLLVYF